MHCRFRKENHVARLRDRLVDMLPQSAAVGHFRGYREIHLVAATHNAETAIAFVVRGEHNRHGNQRVEHGALPAHILQVRVEAAIARQRPAVQREAFRPFLLRDEEWKMVHSVSFAD